jgi:hypothetical protein
MAPYRKVRKFWRQTGWPVVTADSDTEIFNLSKARNNAVRKAKTEVVIVADADTIPPLDSVITAVNTPIGVIWPHERWVLIPAEYAKRPFEDFPQAPTIIEYEKGLGGVMVTTAEEYWRVGGMPEEFEGWGFEDCAFHLIASTLSYFQRIGGTAYSINHNDEKDRADSPGWDRKGRHVSMNAGRIEPYMRAAGRAWLMREIIKQRDEAPPENDPLAGRYAP